MILNYDTGSQPVPDSSILFVGDCKDTNYFDSQLLSSALIDQISSVEVSVMNLEAPVETGTPIQKWGPTNQQCAKSVKKFSEAGFNVATLANNHTMDHGIEGLSETITVCENIGLQTVGTGDDIKSSIEPIYFKISGKEIALFNLCEREFGMATEQSSGVAWINHPGTERKISDIAEEVDIVLVVAHGGIEYIPLPPRSWQRKFRSLAKAGADAIIGHHPHVVQGWEVYQSTPIFYSLGNFVYMMHDRPETRWSITLTLELNEQGVGQANIRPVEIRNGKVKYVEGEKSEQIWTYLKKVSAVIEHAFNDPGYWQEISARLYKSGYEGRIEDFGQSSGVLLSENPKKMVKKLLPLNSTESTTSANEHLSLLNYMHNASHSDLIQTALELRTGTVEDERTVEIKDDLDVLFEWTDQQQKRSSTERFFTRVRENIDELP